MRKRKLVLSLLLIGLLFASCAGSSPYGKRHRSKRKCNCPTFSFFFQSSDETTYRLPSA